ncbi:hypothetical protein [Flavobacterium sp. BFFFF1]|nr:hypothetical protein [Flavobacterium sp. BFFFF1]
METIVNDFSIPLMLWQALNVLLIATAIYVIVRLYRRVMKYLDNK